ncbi:MAG TPA: hypothetical protein DCY75_07910, partial [Clostridiales bacterium]|nr:hypothetical protein [Clostridiales bacterium]
MLQYSPKTKRKSWFALLIAFLLMIVCWAASQTIEAYRLLFQIGSLIAAMLFIQITSRYLLPRYHYRLEGKMFSVIKVQGKRVSTLCHVDLSEAILLIDRRTLQKSKEKHPSLS